jgi:hypothetical protein
MDIKQTAKEILLKNINIEGIVFDILDEVLEAALKEVVAKTSNQYDDMLMVTVFPLLEKEVKRLISEKIAAIKA